MDRVQQAQPAFEAPSPEPGALSIVAGLLEASYGERWDWSSDLSEEEAAARRVSDTEGPLISVVTVCKDARRFIPRAIASVRAQTYRPTEHVIQDARKHRAPLGEAALLPSRLRLARPADHRNHLVGMIDGHGAERLASGRLVARDRIGGPGV